MSRASRVAPIVVIAVVALVAAGDRAARAGGRGFLRLGVAPLDLAPSPDTPLIGGYLDDAVTAYNAAASSYNRAHGLAAGSTMAAAPIDRSALGVHATMMTFAPGVEAGGDTMFFRLEAQVGVSDTHRAIGVGVYPLNVAWPMRGGALTPYLSAGGAVAWLARTDGGGESGGLLSARVAIGARVGRRWSVELGYGVIAVGGLLDRAQLDSMAHYDPRGAAPPPAPDRAVAGGEASGALDLSVAVWM